MVSANRVAAINPPIDDTDPIRKFSIDSGSHMDLENPVEFSPKGKPIRNFSIDPTSSIRTRLRTPFLRTPFLRLLKFTRIYQGALKGTNLRGQTEPKRTFSQIFADFCRFSPFPRKRSIWETQIFAENRRFSQETAENRRNPQKTADWRLSP